VTFSFGPGTVSAAAPLISLLVAIGAGSVPHTRATSAGQGGTGGAAGSDLSDAGTRALCGTACHRLPPADVLPRASWRDTIVRMSLIRSGEAETPETFERQAASLPDDMRRAVAYYEARAPAALADPEPWPAPEPGAQPRFEVRAIAPPDAPPPGVAHLALLDIAGDKRLELIVSDMRHGLVVAHRPYVKEDGFVQLARVPHPAHATLADLDRDGTPDLVVADLGSFLPADHRDGAVVWLHGQRSYAPFVDSRIASALPRVAAVEPGDFDGDGDAELAVAAFGWRKSGSLLLIDRQWDAGAKPQSDDRVLDPRTGAIHAIPADLDRDGRLDIVALFAQEHESVTAYMNRGSGTFRAQTIYAAPHPNWGSSGIQVVDLDGDGDLDVLLAHGDTFDDLIVKPYHGIQWLENRGTFPFVEHTLAALPGVLRARAVDLDSDGDLDVLAASMVFGAAGAVAAKLASIVWLERLPNRQFRRHTLEMGSPTHAAIDAGDFDLDGDVDFVVGNFSNAGSTPASWVQIWENKTK
jgi:FG-GAP-like repeat